MSRRTRLTSFIALLTIGTAVLAAGERPAVTGEKQRYQIMSGDTLGLVAARFGLESAVLARDNGLAANARLKPGDTLEIDNRHVVPIGFDDGIAIIYEPLLVAKQGRDVFVEVHRDPYGRGGISRAALTQALAALGEDGLASHPEIDALLRLRAGRAVSLHERAEASMASARR